MAQPGSEGESQTETFARIYMPRSMKAFLDERAPLMSEEGWSVSRLVRECVRFWKKKHPKPPAKRSEP